MHGVALLAACYPETAVRLLPYIGLVCSERCRSKARIMAEHLDQQEGFVLDGAGHSISCCVAVLVRSAAAAAATLRRGRVPRCDTHICTRTALRSHLNLICIPFRSGNDWESSITIQCYGKGSNTRP